MPKNDPNRTYVGVLPLLLEFFATQRLGNQFSVVELSEQTGFSFRQVRDSLHHAHKSGRLNVPPVSLQDGAQGVQWNGLGPHAKVVDRNRVARGPVRVLNQQLVGTATESIPAGGSGTIALHPVSLVAPQAVYTMVRELKDGALLLEDGDGELYKAVRI